MPHLPARPLRAVVAVLLAVGLLAACSAEAEEDPAPLIVIGVGSTVEQQVLAALTVVVLEHEGIATEVRPDLGDTVALRRQASIGRIDLYWDYTGAAWALGLGQQNPPAEPIESYQRVAEEDRGNGLIWLEPTSANATLAMFVRADELPPESEPNSMDWLAGTLSVEQEALCVDADFRRRPGGLAELAQAYPMDLARLEIVSAEEEQAIEHVAAGRCFAGLATATSGEARDAGLVPVEDDLGIFPAFIVAPVVREEPLSEVPEVAGALESVVQRLDTESLAWLNAEVAAGGEAEDVARRFLADVVPEPTSS